MPHLDAVHIAIGLALGAAIGAAGGLFGIGGGLLAVPILGTFFGQDQPHAQGTAMVMVAPNVIAGLVQYARRKPMDLRVAVTLALSAIPFSYAGAQIATHVDRTLLRHGFASFMGLLGAYVLAGALRSGVPRGTARVPVAWGWAAPLGAAGGLLSGTFSVGGAIFAVPLLARMFGTAQTAAQGLGLALVAPGTLVGLAAYARAGDVDWATGIPLAAGGVLTVGYGVAVAHRLRERTLRALFGALLAASSAALWLVP